MSKINFYLKGSLSQNSLSKLKTISKNKADAYLNKPLPVMLYCSIHGKRYQIPVGKSVQPLFWNYQTMRVKTNLFDTPASLKEFNKKINSIDEILTDFLERNRFSCKMVTIDSIRNLICLKDSSQISIDKHGGIINLIDYFMKNHRTRKGVLLAQNTLKIFNTIKIHLTEFNSLHYPNFNWEDINQHYIFQYIDWLYDTRDCVDNTVAKCVNKLVQLLKFATQEGIHIDQNVLKIHLSEHEIPIVIVELPELELMYNHDFNDEKLARVRDVFIFMAWTGQRYSDYLKLKRWHLTKKLDEDVWEVSSKKTKDTSITIPLNDIALSILDKYKNEPQPIPHFYEQDFNELLKEMAAEVKLNRIVKVIKSKRGIIEQLDCPLYEALSSHMARKSFISNWLILGMSVTQVKKISAHRDDRSFRRYTELGDSVIKAAKNKVSRENVLALSKELYMS